MAPRSPHGRQEGKIVTQHVTNHGDMPDQRYFIDANVLLNVAEPSKPEQQMSSVAFLESRSLQLVTSPIVVVEVDRQLRKYPWKYRGKRRVMQWVLACEVLDVKSRQTFIEELGVAYAENRWHGESGDDDDRLHAATASVYRIPFLVTRDRRLRSQEAWVAEVNRRYGLGDLRLIPPDAG